MDKPFAPACEKNQDPILEVLKQIILPTDRRLLEIGSGTGQHAVYLAPYFPQLDWYPTDLSVNLAGMTLWFKEAKIPNIQRPVRLDVSKDDFPKVKFDVVFTANTFHIMHWKDCKSLMKLLGNRLRENSRAVFYGPFKYEGEFTSPSNAEFDATLREKDPLSGIRAFEDVNNNMIKNGFELVEDFEMPAHNRMLVYKRLKFMSKLD
jgi:cyclopropane fatty-acyl-phospholipid synthase-like methyltransferase